MQSYQVEGHWMIGFGDAMRQLHLFIHCSTSCGCWNITNYT